MDRLELQQLAELRLVDAEALLASGRWAAAYYLLGYVVECALKACIAKRFREHEVPERKLVNSFYTHKLDELVAISRLEQEFEARVAREPRFAANWDTVSEWNESVRYDILMDEALARGLHRAITEQEFGIFTWLRTWW